MKRPIFVVDETDVDIFLDEESLSSYMELYDIDENSAFDAQGQRLQLVSSGGDKPVVIVKPLEYPEYQPDVLSERISRYLNAIDSQLNTKNLTLDELVSLSINAIGYS